jgi:hypothetical protein
MSVRHPGQPARNWWLVLLAVTLLATMSSVAQASTWTASYAAAISSGSRISAGATVPLTLTLGNDSASASLGSAELTVGSNATHSKFTFMSVDSYARLNGTASRGVATLAGDVIQLRNLSLPPRAFVTVAFTAQADCEAGDYRWIVSAKPTDDFSGAASLTLQAGPATRLTIPVGGECELEFLRQPAAAEVSAGITDGPLDPAASPIQVQVESESGQIVTESDDEVTLSIDHVPPGGTGELDGTTTVEPVDGVATFCDTQQLPHCELPSIGTHGQGYTLSARSEESDSVESKPFDVVDDGVVCTQQGPCRVYARFGETASAIRVLAEPGDLVSVSIGVDRLRCHGYTTTSEVVTFGSTAGSVTGGKLTFDEGSNTKPASAYQLCFSSSLPFTDRYGHVVPPGGSGILPDCSMEVGPPCTVSRTENEATGYVTLRFLSPAGDPRIQG